MTRILRLALDVFMSAVVFVALAVLFAGVGVKIEAAALFAGVGVAGL